MAAATSNAAVDAGKLGVYADNLEKLAEEDLIEMFELAEKKCKFFPSVAELLALVGADEDDPDDEIRHARRACSKLQERERRIR